MDNQSKSLGPISQQIGASSLKQYSFYIVISGLVVLQLVIGGVLGFFTLNNINTSNSAIPQLETQVNRLEQVANTLDGVDGSQVRTQLSQAAMALPTEKKVSGIISSLTALASASGVVVNRLELTPCNISTRSAVVKTKAARSQCENVTLQNGVSGVPLTMEVIAQEDKLQAFVQKLYRTSPILGLQRVDYSFSAKGKVADLSLLLFFQPQTGQGNPDILVPLSQNEEDVVRSLGGRATLLP